MTSQTQTAQLKAFRFKTNDNPMGWLFVAEDTLTALKLFTKAFPKCKSFSVRQENKNADRRISLN